jgi:hypothetical protein
VLHSRSLAKTKEIEGLIAERWDGFMETALNYQLRFELSGTLVIQSFDLVRALELRGGAILLLSGKRLN